MTHELKTVNPHFADVLDGCKTFELRKNDRNFQVGDTLVLKEYNPETDHYSGSFVVVTVSHILSGFKGVEDGYVIMSIEHPTPDSEMSIAKDALVDISNWDSNMAFEWGDPGVRAQFALDQIASHR